MELAAYLRRIGYDGEVRRDLRTLRALHRAHALAVPYDALDIPLGRPVSNDVTAAYEKIVERGRGGWCYENNGLFAWALAEAGFDAVRLSGDGQEPGSHLVINVELAGTWVCDVGFGEGPVEPYPLIEGAFSQRGFDFRLERQEEGWRFHNHRFGLVPGFTFTGPDEAAMTQRCEALQSRPDSVYRQNAIVLRQMEAGYRTLIGREMRDVTPEGRSKRRLIGTPEEYVATLQSVFGLQLPEAGDLWPAICRRHDEIEGARAAAAAPNENVR